MSARKYPVRSSESAPEALYRSLKIEAPIGLASLTLAAQKVTAVDHAFLSHCPGLMG